MNTVNEIFTAAYEACPMELPFKKEWSNGKGYFLPAVEGTCKPILDSGDVVKSITPAGRRLLIIGTRLGNVCVFDRYTDQRPGEKNAQIAVFAFDCTGVFFKNDTILDWSFGWASTEAIDFLKMTTLVGHGKTVNIGQRLELALH